MESVEGRSNDDYIDGLEKLINVSNIRSISKISGGRVCVFLTDKSLVEQLSNETLKVKEIEIRMKPLIEKNKRVVISNVQSHIPNEIITGALKNKGITLVSNMHNIKASLSKPGRSHIQSFRRQVYIKDGDQKLVPESLQINYDNTTYWVYLSTDATSCFICKQTGHIAKLCPMSTPGSTIDNTPSYNKESIPRPDNILSTPEGRDNTMENVNIVTVQNTSNSIENNTISNIQSTCITNPKSKGKKRNSPPSTSSEDRENDKVYTKNSGHQLDVSNEVDAETPPGADIENDFKKPKTQKKKKLSDTPQNEKPFQDLTTILLPVKDIIENQMEKYPLDFDQFKSFLEKTRGRKNIPEVALEFTENTEGIVKIIDAIYYHLNNHSIKVRCTRIKKQLLLKNFNGTDSETDLSQE